MTKKDSLWSLIYNSYAPEQEGVRESLTTLGNGYFATRGAFCFADADGIHYPGTYLAGGYNRLDTEIAGRKIQNEDLVNLPNWLSLKFRINQGEWFQLKAVQILDFHQELNVKKGLLIRKIQFKDAKGHISTFCEQRFVHMRSQHIGAVQISVRAENWSGEIECLSSLNGNLINSGVARYRELNSTHLRPVCSKIDEENFLFLKVETTQSELRIAQAARNRVWINGERIQAKITEIEEEGAVSHLISCNLLQQQTMTLEKTVALFTSRDRAISECGESAIDTLRAAPDFSSLLASHKQAWKSLWEEFDVEIDLPEPTEKEAQPLLILRLHIFHLLQTVSINSLDLDVGVPARGWHGEAYRGHIFWDELFIFPILNLRMPKITLALLKYRYRRLDEARRSAKEAGFAGAMYPWQSGSSGKEESQRVHLNPKSGRWVVDNTLIQRHVNLSIAYNVWKYYEVTHDIDFLRAYGAEMLLEIARFFVSLTTYNKTLQKYEIHGIMGPDEYHDAYPGSNRPGLSNNAYTNLLGVWVLTKAIKLLEILPEDHNRELREMLGITREEMDKWEHISCHMRVCFHRDGIISQFEGYEKLKEFPWEEYREKYGDIQRLDRILESEGDTPNRYKLSKQADLLMLFYLFSAEELTEIIHRLGYSFDPASIPKHIHYYEKRTSHGSTLSRIVHSWVISREDRAVSWELFVRALESDVEDVQGGTTQEGIHLGAMAGTVDLIQRCYTGVEARNNVLWLNPFLPETLTSLRVHLHYRGHSIELTVTQNTLTTKAKKSFARPILIGFRGQTYPLEADKTLQFSLQKRESLVHAS